MTAVREEILRTVAGRSDEELLRVPPDGGWCAAEVLDHIATAEGKLVKALDRHERGEPTRVPRRAWFYRLPMTPFFSRIRFRAPKMVRPRPRAELSPREVLARLADSRRALLARAEGLGEERFARLVFPHFLLGRFTGVSWFRFIAGHEGKHLEQIRRALA
jgi:hypothetical protein